MGKWSNYKGLEGKYFSHLTLQKVLRLKKYLYQDFYQAEDVWLNHTYKVWVEDLNEVFETQEQALQSMLTKLKAKAMRTERVQTEEKPKTPVVPEHELGVPQGAWAEDAGIYGWDLD